MKINTMEKLIDRIEWFGMVKCGKYNGDVMLNKKQWKHIKSECSPSTRKVTK